MLTEDRPSSRRDFVLRKGETGIFVYGSLLSLRSMEITLGKRYSRARIICELAGFKRAWNIIAPNDKYYTESATGIMIPQHIVYLNVIRCSVGSVNGVCVALEPEDVEELDLRESPSYDRVNITNQLRDINVSGGEVFVYEGKQAWLLRSGCSPEWAAIRQSYLTEIAEGLCELGDHFREKYGRSTDTLPGSLIIDDKILDR